jgi:hypothetical protein
MANEIIADGIVIADTVTKLGDECPGNVLIGGSHGGVYAAYLACKAGVRGVILNDAGRGKDEAGIGGGAYCQELAIPYATVDTMTARIGNGRDMATRGVISFANPLAAELGVTVGMTSRAAAEALKAAELAEKPVPAYEEARSELPAAAGQRQIVIVDSASLVYAQDTGRIIVTGSHGALLGGEVGSPLMVDAFAAFYNDAGGGADGIGFSRLAALDERNIVAATVAAMSARIGDGRSTYGDGMLSHVNQAAAALGAEIGQPLKDFIAGMVAS